MSVRELVVMAPLVVLIFWMGIFPDHFLRYSKNSIEHLVANKDAYQLVIHQPGASTLVPQIAEQKPVSAPSLVEVK
jgi:NADH-quinone oxidoreductase subunit M